MTSEEYLLYHPSRAGFLMAGLAVLLFAVNTSSAVEGESACAPPESLIIENSKGMFKLEADQNGQKTALEEIDFLTKLRWFFVSLIRDLEGREVKIHLFNQQDSEFLDGYENIEDTKIVKFFLVCEDNGEYIAVPGSISKLSVSSMTQEPSQGDWNQEYLGMTFRPKDTTPYATLRGDFSAFLD